MRHEPTRTNQRLPPSAGRGIRGHHGCSAADDFEGVKMRTLILSNWSQNIADLNVLTAPNKQAYADAHGYDFENIELDYSDQVEWLELLRDRVVGNYDIVMTIGCDAIFTNFSRKIEDMTGLSGQNPQEMQPIDRRVIIAKEHISFWPINNDVMIWPAGIQSRVVLNRLIRDKDIWLKYKWLWQMHLWNLIQETHGPKDSQAIRIIEARDMNSTFQPFTVDSTSNCFRTIGPSSWQLGDWILHALDMTPEMRIQVIKWGLGFVGDGSWRPL